MRTLASKLHHISPGATSPSLSERLHYLENDKRGVQRAVPVDVGRYLNEAQLLALQSLEGFGWQLAFVRRPLFMEPVVVVHHPDHSQYALLEDDGAVNQKVKIGLRA